MASSSPPRWVRPATNSPQPVESLSHRPKIFGSERESPSLSTKVKPTDLQDLEAAIAVSQQDDAQLRCADRRKRDRQPLDAVQRIAPWNGSAVPDEADFFEVMCRDVSSTGISFLLSTRPSFESFVIALGSSSNLTLVAAEVVHCMDVLVDRSGVVERVSGDTDAAERDGPQAERMVLVGARLLQ